MKTLTKILLETMKKAALAFCFLAFAINANAQNNAQTNALDEKAKIKNDDKVLLSIEEAQPTNIVISNEKQKKASVEITIPEDAVFTENEETNQFYLSHPDFPKYMDTGNKEKDTDSYSKAVNEWAKNNKAEFKKILKEQASKQRAENDISKVKKTMPNDQ